MWALHTATMIPCVLLVQAAQQAFMAELFADALKFGGAVMIRRIVGIAHVEDFQAIEEDNARSATGMFPARLCRPTPYTDNLLCLSNTWSHVGS